MFDKDKEIGASVLDAFGLGTPFVLWEARVADEQIETRIGLARKSIMVCTTLAEQKDKREYTTLASAIADKIEQQEPGDLPAIVELRKVESSKSPGQEALVLQFVAPLSSDPFEGMDTTTGEVPAEQPAAKAGRK